MTVSTTDSVIEYTAGGPGYPIPYRFLQDSDIQAVLVKQNGTSETLVLGTQYSLTGAGSQSGGTLTSAYAAGFLATPGATLSISRVMVATQPTDLRNQGKFLAETHETVFDRLTMLIQQGFSLLARALVRPPGKNYYDAEGRQIKNLGDPTGNQDATTRSWVLTQVNSVRNDLTTLAYTLYNQSIAYAESLVAGVVGGYGAFLQSGTGAVIRTFQSKMRDIFNTRDFGVTADGTDQSSKMQATVNAADAVDVASGTFLVEQTVRANGKKLNLRGSVRAFNSLIPESLAHDQVVPGLIIADSYTPFDYSRFGRMDPTILAYGDSNTAWVDATSTRIGVGQGSWPAYLEAHLAKYSYFAVGRVRGDGSPGRTSQFALDNFDLFMTTYDPQVAILGWGTNDIAQGVSRAAYLANMALLIERFRQRGVLTIVLGIPWHGTYFNESKAWNSSLATLCQNYGVDFVPVYTVFANASTTYFAADGIHYTVIANQVIAEILHDIIVRNYGIPKNRMTPFLPRPASSQDAYSWTCEGIRHSNGMKLQIVQTPDVYVRRLFPYAIKIDAGQEVSITAAGPFSALFDYPDSIGASWTLNGLPYSPVTRGTVIKLNSTSPRLDGSSSSFRVGCTSGSIYLVSTLAEFGFPSRVYSTAEIRNGLYVPGQIISIADATHKLDTIMAQVSGTTDIGYAVDLDIANVGPISVRTAITSAPVGFKFLQPDDDTWWRWNGSAWSAM